MFFLGLITRCKDEFFVKEFCDYYLSQGVDKIYVIDDNSDDKSIYDNIKDDRVKIIYEENLFADAYDQMYILNKYYKELKNNFKWMISVDVDEFVTTKKNSTNTIRQELETTFNEVDCIMIPWVMMSCNKREKNPKSILKENTYRWDHDKKHPKGIKKFRCRYNAIEVKCIFKTDKFDEINVHIPSKKKGSCIIVDGVNKIVSKRVLPYYKNLRENDIKNGYLLCYHYRIISVENCKKKLKKAQYLKYSLEDLLESDYPEIIDYTLKNKV